ncbi:hypothetical protein GCM10010401_14190 [Rarobacter faecitabidus]|uniref:Uncharacterized protein n=1 Tax=Rarobacter faecitabidus TaxID=13243 RepID=A0A542ZDV8_RARFA|nr:hypothetical protein [Rarobacter faecitabidus]TQL58534.1 hypothetical protein FB461_1949 [Rarobacter faecitabidus]
MTSAKEAAEARAAVADREHLRAALESERQGYVSRGLTKRAKQVEEQLKKLPSLDAPAEKVELQGDQQPSTTRKGSPRGAVKPSDTSAADPEVKGDAAGTVEGGDADDAAGKAEA